MATMKPIRILYQAKGNTTGLADVKAQIYFNGVAKAVAGAAIALTEVDSTNSPGLYELLIPAASLTTWGAVAGSYNCVEGYIDSASKSAKAPFREEVTVANADDLDSHLTTVDTEIAAVQTKLGTPSGASVSADIAAVKGDTAAIKVDLESGASSLATILSNIQALANGSISNGVGYVLPNMLIPTSGTNTYVIPITIMNNDGALVDPTTNLVTVGLKNAAGTDRGSYLTGSSGSPATVSSTRASLGQYNVTVVIPTSAIEEDLLFSFAYTIGANAMLRYGQTQLLVDMGASGFALQTTLLATQTAVNAIKADVESGTTGLAVIQGLLANGTYGLSALQALLANGTYGLSALQALLSNGTYGLSALQSLLTNATYGLSALQVQGAATQGSGFVGATDSLHAVSAYLTANLFVGGRAV